MVNKLNNNDIGYKIKHKKFCSINMVAYHKSDSRKRKSSNKGVVGSIIFLLIKINPSLKKRNYNHEQN